MEYEGVMKKLKLPFYTRLRFIRSLMGLDEYSYFIDRKAYSTYKKFTFGYIDSFYLASGLYIFNLDSKFSEEIERDIAEKLSSVGVPIRSLNKMYRGIRLKRFYGIVLPTYKSQKYNLR